MSLSFLVPTAHTSPFPGPGGEDEPDMTLPTRQLGAGDAHSVTTTQASAAAVVLVVATAIAAATAAENHGESAQG